MDSTLLTGERPCEPATILRNLRVIDEDRDRSELEKVRNAVVARAAQAATLATVVRRRLGRGSVAVLGGGAVGVAVVEALLRAGWPPKLVEVTDEEAAIQGVALTRKRGAAARRALIVIVTVRPAALDDLARSLKGALAEGRFVVSCVVGVQTSKQSATLGCAYMTRTKIDADLRLNSEMLEFCLRQALQNKDDATAFLEACRDFTGDDTIPVGEDPETCLRFLLDNASFT